MLIRDQVDWAMPGNRVSSRRRLRVWRLPEGTLVAVITERGSGASVTNMAREAYTAVVAEYEGATVRVFEHHPDGGPGWPEHFDEISLADGRPRWRRFGHAEMLELVGPGVLLGPQQHRQPIRAAPPAGLSSPVGPGLPSGAAIHGEAPGRLVTVLAEDGQILGLLPHWKRHAAEFCWGYHGSGPAELARCILIAVLGEEARCRSCAGTGYLVYDEATGRAVPAGPDEAGGVAQDVGRCGDCDIGLTVTPALYQQFKDDVIAGLPDQEWTLSVAGIRAWLTAALK